MQMPCPQGCWDELYSQTEKVLMHKYLIQQLGLPLTSWTFCETIKLALGWVFTT